MNKLLCAVFMLSGFPVLSPAWQVADLDSTYVVNIALNQTNIKLMNIKLAVKNGQCVLSGRLKRRQRNLAVASGHLDIAFSDAKSQSISNAFVDYSPHLSLRRWRHGSQFIFVIPETLSPGSLIHLSWHNYSRHDQFF